MANTPFLFVVALSVPLSVLLSSFVVALTLRSVATINSVYRKLRRDILQEPNYVELPSRKFSYGVNISIKVTHIVRVHLQIELRKYEINEQPSKFPFKNSKIKSTYELTLYQSVNIIATWECTPPPYAIPSRSRYFKFYRSNRILYFNLKLPYGDDLNHSTLLYTNFLISLNKYMIDIKFSKRRFQY